MDSTTRKKKLNQLDYIQLSGYESNEQD